MSAPAPVSLEGMSPQEITNMAALSIALSKNKETAKDFQRIVRKVIPDFRSPELEADDAVEAATKPLADKIAKMEQERQTELAQARWRELREQAMKHGVTQAELDDGSFTKYMESNGFNVTQMPMAAKYRAQERQLAEPTPETGPLTPTRISRDIMKEVRKDPNGFMEREGLAAVNEIRARRSTAA